MVQALLADLGKPQARVTVLTDPHLRGVDEAIAQAAEIARDYPMHDLFLLLLDRDSKTGNGENRLARLQTAERRAAEDGRTLVACAAIEEVEVWLLGAHPGKVAFLDFAWQDIRSEVHPKERFFDPFLAEFGDLGPGGGRKRLMQEGTRRLRGLLGRCEELAELRERIREALAL